MSEPTNHLVEKKGIFGRARRLSIPAAALLIGALAGSIIFHESVVQAASVPPPLTGEAVAPLVALDHAVENVSARVMPAVVNVAVTSHETAADAQEEEQQDGGQQQQVPPGFGQFFGPNGPFGGFGGGQGQRQQQQPQFEHGVGSGVIISPDGYIVTNDHVVDGAVQIMVTLHDRRVMHAKLIGVDKLDDLAVIKIDGANLPSIPWGDSTKLEPGETVLAFGSPFGSFEDSVTRGIVSGLNRQNPYRTNDRQPGAYIQTDAAINPGNSGGALVDAHGELIGINTFIISNSGSFAGAGFAIPSQIAEKTVQELIAHGKVQHGYLGIGMNDVTPENAGFFDLKTATGAVIAQVSPDSPADHAGLKSGDVIVALNGQSIVNGSALQIAVSQDAPGTHITLGIIRDGQPKTLDVTVGQFNGTGAQSAANSGGTGTATNPGKLGLSVQDLTPDLRQQLSVPTGVQGAVIEQVRPGSVADDAGLTQGDVIVSVDRKPVTSASDFANVVQASPAGKGILLLVWTKGAESFLVLQPPQGSGGGM